MMYVWMDFMDVIAFFILASFWMMEMLCFCVYSFFPWVVSDDVGLREFPLHLTQEMSI
jgi:hypothetical protein